ncbi:MAG: peptidase C60 sortase A and B [uncultured bacterium]|uniref:Peptidase C60 sortase A and B n=1 Tax=Candidatus Daviesbacteria bacterium GW2011_GWC2_40_12 TaxID=1618431 RepID=A0A0G0QQH6_9BACT|nr:MAG: peptidase C60 sortase A and B [uncultured bacterium]KKQ85505.1 MAG: Peptidase C60 sortase A and B [Candidatus Daviesbacteria bacterium GW2011_GWF2_38_7]KKR16815.1 MAG: Peptidase C60 sortase A and B [Candidatus Daviesbacteria bacterium GW2011_GWA2_39_33]KKR24472.1 MAG: Peptidase C60 sortase A and B [Candidatus Daviesbacteria bacterium GW2011_GWB1_39_5]KKR42403.1 MAG: Peptidase C60 sortase A and B [Candidatus Daviesbacteria bacterium GW2011_GWC2_40_12]OGE22316.1 MAG: hypothetical protein
MKKKLSIVWIVIIFAVLGMVGGTVFVNRNLQVLQQTVPQAVQKEAVTPILAQSKESVQAAEPRLISIPKINITADVESVGEDEKGRMAVPGEVMNVGWYKLGYKPGEKGSAVFAGHLDKVTGEPAVFYDISKLSAGDEIIVTDKNGKKLTFEVIKSQVYPFDEVPLKEVFLSTDKIRLNLITCTGSWNKDDKNYSNRLVVYSQLK